MIFLWKLYTYDANEDKWFENRSYGHGDEIVPVGVHLLNKCLCGGKPEIYFDHADDFFVRCSSCHTSTYSNMWFKESVDAWNRGDTENTKIGLRNTHLGENSSKFVFSNQITNYNEEIYSHVIQPTFGVIKYLECYEIHGHEKMTFTLDDTKLTITTNGKALLLSLAEPRQNNFVVAKRNKLFFV